MLRTARRTSVGAQPMFRIPVGLALFFGVVLAASAGDLGHIVKLNIQAQPLESALRALAKQADIQIMFAPKVAAGITAPAVSGAMSARKALALLLRSTGLEFQADGADTVIVRKKSPQPSAAPATSGTDSGRNTETAALQEVVVTAEKRSEPLSKVPIAVTALSQAQMTAAGVQGIRDLVSAVPNTEIRTVGFANAVQLTIRGISNSDFSEDSDPAIATYIDGIYVGRTQGLNGSLYDLERIEVLRGPQGTLYGRNATGGNLNVVTASPKIGRFAGSADASFGNYGDAETHGMVNIPLTDQFAVRAAVVTHRSNGYFNTDGTTARNYGAADDFGGRITMLWEPSEDFNWRLAAENYTSHGTPSLSIDTSPNGEPADGLPVFDRPVTTNPEPLSYLDNWMFRSRMVWQLAKSLSLSYVAGYQHITSDDRGDFSGTVTPGFDGSRNVTGKSYQHELDVNFNGERLTNILGASYFHQTTYEDDVYHLYYVDFSFGGGAKDELDRAWGVYDQATFSITHRLRVTGGVRYSSEYKDRTSHFFLGCNGTGVSLDAMLAVPAFAPPGTPLPPGCTYTYDGFVPNALTGAPETGSWSNVSWKAAVNYDFTDRTMGYLSVTTGFKAGGLQNAAVGSIKYNPEDVTNYEAGLKTRLLDDRLGVNTAVFYENYKNLQVTQIYGSGANVSTATTNAAKAAIYGLEIEGESHLTAVDDLQAFFNYLHAKYTSYPNAVDDEFNTNVGDLSARYLPHAPEFSARLQYSHDFTLPNNGSLKPMAAVYWQSASYLRPFNFAIDRVGAYTKTDLNLAYIDPTGHWTVQGYVYNVENKIVRNGAFTFLAHYFSDYDPPRTFGLRVSYEY